MAAAVVVVEADSPRDRSGVALEPRAVLKAKDRIRMQLGVVSTATHPVR